MSEIVFYFYIVHSTLVLSSYLDVDLTLSVRGM